MIAALLPRPVHRAGLRLAFRIRHQVRRMRGRPIAGVSLILRDRGGRILLVRHSYGSRDWALPGGGLHTGEDPLEAGKRELREELQVDACDWQAVSVFQETISNAPHTAHLFTARLAGTPRADRREIVATRFVQPDRLPADTGALTWRRIEIWREWQATSLA